MTCNRETKIELTILLSIGLLVGIYGWYRHNRALPRTWTRMNDNLYVCTDQHTKIEGRVETDYYLPGVWSAKRAEYDTIGSYTSFEQAVRAVAKDTHCPADIMVMGSTVDDNKFFGNTYAPQ